MPLTPFIRLGAALLILGTARYGMSQTALTNDSPFLPAAGMSGGTSGAAASESLELAGASVTSDGDQVCIYNKLIQRSRWISVGTTVDQIQVISYDPALDQAVIRFNGEKKLLALRKAVPAVSGQAPSGLNYSFPVAAPAPVVVQDAPTLSPPPNLTPKQTEMVKQEQEARMLVSDLMEIGIQQRKAYEDAKKAQSTAQK